MKHWFILLFPLTWVSCNQSAKVSEPILETTAPAPSSLSVSLLSSPIDPVCEMELSDDGIADTLDLNGKIYGFCAVECKAELLKSPQNYLK